jgi:hypothetical protein
MRTVLCGGARIIKSMVDFSRADLRPNLSLTVEAGSAMPRSKALSNLWS